jgi:hypothetical protein
VTNIIENSMCDVFHYRHRRQLINASRKGHLMSPIKLAAMLVMPMAFFCSIAAAQERPSPEPQIQASIAVKDEVYGSYVPYKGPVLKPVSTPTPPPVANTAPVACNTEWVEDKVYGSYVPYQGPPLKSTSCLTNTQPASINSPQHASPVLKAPPKEEASEALPLPPAPKAAPPVVAAADTPPPNCVTNSQTTHGGPSDSAATPPKDEFYGMYVPYTGPPLKSSPQQVAADAPSPPACTTVAALPQPRLDSPAANEIALAAPSPTSAPLPSAPPIGDPSGGAPAGGSGYIRVMPAPIPEKQPLQIKPFRSVAIGVKADTLGAGLELATPLSHSFNLRSSFNVLPFNYGFSIDGVNYNARFHLQSSEAVLDWFPLHGSFHVSPGVLYAKNSLSGTTSVGPGQSFTLGNQPFINSVDDPAHGSASVIYPHKVAPMLLFGFGNIIPRNGSHFSFPVEFGAAYTGAPQMSVSLNGTACTKDGCANFGTNTQAQTFLKQEVNDLNSDLRSFPFYPVVSIGVAYHFYSSSHHAPND